MFDTSGTAGGIDCRKWRKILLFCMAELRGSRACSVRRSPVGENVGVYFGPSLTWLGIATVGGTWQTHHRTELSLTEQVNMLQNIDT